jgi:hypothetical protein
VHSVSVSIKEGSRARFVYPHHPRSRHFRLGRAESHWPFPSPFHPPTAPTTREENGPRSSGRCIAENDENEEDWGIGEDWVRGLRYQPRTQEKIRGTTIVASDSIMNFGVSSESLPQVIFSFGTAPEYEP